MSTTRLMDPELWTFLCKFRDASPAYNFTSQLLGFTGKFRIERNNFEEFWTIYCDAVASKPNFLSGLAERPNECQPLRVDVDLEAKFSSPALRKSNSSEFPSRLYTEEHVLTVVRAYQRVLQDVAKGSLNERGSIDPFRSRDQVCLVLEKPTTYLSGDKLKHGFHLHFPRIWVRSCDHDFHIFPRVRSLLNTENPGLFAPFIPELETGRMLDGGICNKHWLLYGSAKSERSLSYRLSYTLDSNGDKISLSQALAGWPFFDVNDDPIDLSDEKRCIYLLPQILSIHPANRNALILKPGLECINNKPIQTAKQRSEHHESINVSEMVNIAKDLMPLIASWRADSYQSWWEMLCCLYQIGDGTQEALDLAIEFSKQTSRDNYDEAKVLYYWERMIPNNYTIATLHHFARVDNPDLYEVWKRERAQSRIRDVLEGGHTYVAKMLHDIFGNIYVLADIKQDLWFEFKEHRWHEICQGLTLRRKITDEIMPKFREELSRIYVQLGDNGESNDLQDKLKQIKKVIYSLNQAPFKTNVLKEAKELFYNSEFIEQLDSNPNLIAFENGIFDIIEMKFREGRPEDYILRSTGYNYIEFNNDDPAVLEVQDFIVKIFPDPELRVYFLEYTAQLLKGGNFRKLFLNLTGEGDNGKSVLIDFLEHVLGKGRYGYAVKLPTSLITGKRTQSSSASPELSRLQGIRFAVLQEPDGKDVINVGLLKELTGNDSFYCRGLFKDGKEVTPQFKLALVCNKLPRLSSDDIAIWNRMLVLECQSTFPKPDSEIKVPQSEDEQLRLKIFPRDDNFSEKIPRMIQPFMWLLIQKLKEILLDGPGPVPAQVIKATENYRRNNDVYRKYCDERIVKNANTGISLSEVWADFQTWFRDSFGNKQQMPTKDDLKTDLNRRWGDPRNRDGLWPGLKVRGLQDSLSDGQALTLGDDELDDGTVPEEAMSTPISRIMNKDR